MRPIRSLLHQIDQSNIYESYVVGVCVPYPQDSFDEAKFFWREPGGIEQFIHDTSTN